MQHDIGKLEVSILIIVFLIIIAMFWNANSATQNITTIIAAISYAWTIYIFRQIYHGVYEEMFNAGLILVGLGLTILMMIIYATTLF